MQISARLPMTPPMIEPRVVLEVADAADAADAVRDAAEVEEAEAEGLEEVEEVEEVLDCAAEEGDFVVNEIADEEAVDKVDRTDKDGGFDGLSKRDDEAAAVVVNVGLANSDSTPETAAHAIYEYVWSGPSMRSAVEQ